ncbi:lactococcin immunity protein, partial [Spongiactinospora gelatinilytica]
MSFFKNNTKRIPTEVKLLTDIQNALADAPTTEEKPFLLEAEQSLKDKKYLPKILSDLQFFLTPLAIKSALSPKVKVIYLNLISDK